MNGIALEKFYANYLGMKLSSEIGDQKGVDLVSDSGVHIQVKSFILNKNYLTNVSGGLISHISKMLQHGKFIPVIVSDGNENNSVEFILSQLQDRGLYISKHYFDSDSHKFDTNFIEMLKFIMFHLMLVQRNNPKIEPGSDEMKTKFRESVISYINSFLRKSIYEYDGHKAMKMTNTDYLIPLASKPNDPGVIIPGRSGLVSNNYLKSVNSVYAKMEIRNMNEKPELKKCDGFKVLELKEIGKDSQWLIGRELKNPWYDVTNAKKLKVTSILYKGSTYFTVEDIRKYIKLMKKSTSLQNLLDKLVDIDPSEYEHDTAWINKVKINKEYSGETDIPFIEIPEGKKLNKDFDGDLKKLVLVGKDSILDEKIDVMSTYELTKIQFIYKGRTVTIE